MWLMYFVIYTLLPLLWIGHAFGLAATNPRLSSKSVLAALYEAIAQSDACPIDRLD